MPAANHRTRELGLFVDYQVGVPCGAARCQVCHSLACARLEVVEPRRLVVAAGLCMGHADRPGSQTLALRQRGDVGTGSDDDVMPGVVRGASQRQHGVDVTVERIADEQDAHGQREFRNAAQSDCASWWRLESLRHRVDHLARAASAVCEAHGRVGVELTPCAQSSGCSRVEVSLSTCTDRYR